MLESSGSTSQSPHIKKEKKKEGRRLNKVSYLYIPKRRQFKVFRWKNWITSTRELPEQPLAGIAHEACEDSLHRNLTFMGMPTILSRESYSRHAKKPFRKNLTLGMWRIVTEECSEVPPYPLVYVNKFLVPTWPNFSCPVHVTLVPWTCGKNLNKITKTPQKITRVLTIFVEHDIIACIPRWLSQWKLLNYIIQWSSFNTKCYFLVFDLLYNRHSATSTFIL